MARSPKTGKGSLRYCQAGSTDVVLHFSEEHVQTIKDSMRFRADSCALKTILKESLKSYFGPKSKYLYLTNIHWYRCMK